MTPTDLREEIALELDLLNLTVGELLALQQDVAERQPTMRETAATATFLAQFYTGLENVLKRISRFHNVPLPTGEMWHVELFKRFCIPAYPPLPGLFDPYLAATLAPYRRFRHVVHHGYSFQLDWDRMQEGISDIRSVLAQFTANLAAYLQALEGD